MAKTLGPLLSQDAHGTLGKLLTFSSRRSGSQVRKVNQPTGLPSARQFEHRQLVRMIIAQWQNMTAGQRATWRTAAQASGKYISTYHYFLHSALLDPYTNHGLCGYWSCNRIVAGQILDTSGNNNHGTLQPNYPTSAPKLVTSRAPKFSRGLWYNGSSTFVDLGTGQTLKIGTQDWSAELLVKLDVQGSYRELLRHGVGAVDYWFFEVRSNNNLRILLNKTGVGAVGFQVGPAQDLNWHWLTVTLDRNARARIYRDSKELGSSDISSLDGQDVNPPGNPGICRSGSVWKGIIDEVSIYNRVLSAAEIATRYAFTMK